MTYQIKISFKDYLSEIYNKPAKLHEAYRMFHRYSLSNSVLAKNQMMEPEPINSYAGWKKLGRQVIKGSKAIKLLMPVNCSSKKENCSSNNQDQKEVEKENNNKKTTFTRFIERPYWFALSQTEGEEFKNPELPNFNISEALKKLGIFKENFKSINGNCQGYAFPDLNIIAVNPLAYAPYKTTIHEIAHCLLNKGINQIIDGSQLETSIKEFEAETAAYLVCCSLGKFDHLEYSRGYISGWMKKDNVKEENFKRAFDAANRILKAGLKIEENSEAQLKQKEGK